MKTESTIIGKAVIDGKADVVPSFEQAARKFLFNGDAVSLRVGEKYTPADFEVLIGEQMKQGEQAVASATTRSAYALHCAALVSKETHAEVVARLKNTLSAVAVANLASMAKLVPLVIANGISKPLTTLKDCVQALKADPNLKTSDIPTDKQGKVIKSKLTAAGKKVFAALTGEDKFTQADARKLASEAKKPAAKPSGGTKDTRTEGEKEATTLLFHLSSAVKAMEKAECNADERAKVRVYIAQIARNYGVVVIEDKLQSASK